MSATILIDGNAIGNACHRATRLTVGELETQAVFGMLKTVRDLAQSYPIHDILVLWDGKAEHRYNLYPRYKEKRETALLDPVNLKVKTAYRQQVPLIEKALETLAIKQMVCKNLEADDLAGYIAPRLAATGQNVLLVTGDSDWLQLVSERVTWVDPRGAGKRVNFANFLDATGYHSPAEYLDGKCLIGDSTDDIPPAGGIGKDTAPVFMAQFRSVAEFWRRCDAGEHVPTSKAEKSLWKGTSPHTKEAWEAMFLTPPPPEGSDKKTNAAYGRAQKNHMAEWPGQGRDNYLRNRKLIDLSLAPTPDPKLCAIRPGSVNEVGFRALCERLAFFSILKDYDNFIAPFRKRWTAQQLKAA